MRDLNTRPRRVSRDPLVAGVKRAIADLLERDRSVIRQRYGLEGQRLGDDEAAELLGLSVHELWQAEALAFEAVGFSLLTEATVYELFDASI